MADNSIISLKVKFNGKLMVLDGLLKSQTVLDVKNKLYALTNVPPENQKLLGLMAERGKHTELL